MATNRLLGLLRSEGDLVLKIVVCGVDGGRRAVRLEDPADLFGVEEVEIGPGDYFAAAGRILSLQLERRAPAYLIAWFAVEVLQTAEVGFGMTGEELDRWIADRVGLAGRRRPPHRKGKKAASKLEI